MQITNIPIDKLKPAKYNPRLDLQPDDKEYQDIKRSIVEFTLVEPLVINKDMTVIGGHQRLKVLKDLQYKEVPCIVVDLNKQKEKMLNIALNKISGDWDRVKIKDLILELDTGEYDITLTGWGEQEIEDLMTEFHVETEEDDFDVDKAVEEVGEPICKRGDIWQLGDHRLMCGDATVEEDVKKLMDGKKADMVYCDPPYGMGLDVDYLKVHPNNELGHEGKQHPIYKKVIGDNKEYNPEHIFDFFKECKEIFLWGGDYFIDKLGKNGSWFIWDKVVGRFEGRIGNEFEMCWSKQRHKKVIISFLWVGHNGLEKQDTTSRVHPTQKPIELCSWFINKYSKKDDIIVDLFLGSGSTSIACEQTKRICYGLEISEIYCDVIIKRWEKYTNKKAVITNG